MNICIDKSILFDERLWLAVAGIIELILLVVTVFLLWKKLKKPGVRIISLFAIAPLFFILSWISILVMAYYLEPLNDNNASYFFPLNAAIKNTCYLDTTRLHCPTTLDEVISIESENFKKYQQEAFLAYEYRPQTHDYTLVTLEKGSNRGAIFDPRLKSLPGYGADFVDVVYSDCGNEITIKNPPPIDGIWNTMSKISSYEECAAAGYPIMESYPEQCRTPDGENFVRDLNKQVPSTEPEGY